MDKPSPPPEAALLRLVRTAAGIKAADAAASVSRHSLRRFGASRWSQIENGYETRGGTYKEVRANAATLAHMAYAVGLTPERLESEGGRPDAAEILREIQRNQPAPEPQPATPQAPYPGLAPAFPGETADAEAERAVELTIRLLDPRRPKLRTAYEVAMEQQDGNGRLLPLAERLAAMLPLLELANGIRPAGTQRKNGTTGSAPA